MFMTLALGHSQPLLYFHFPVNKKLRRLDSNRGSMASVVTALPIVPKTTDPTKLYNRTFNHEAQGK